MNDWSTQDTHPLPPLEPGPGRTGPAPGPPTTAVRIDVAGLSDRSKVRNENRRWAGGVELGGGQQRALRALVLLLAPPAGHAGDVVGVARCHVAGEAGFDVKQVRELEARMKKPVPVESASALIDEKTRELGDWRGKTLAKVRAIMHEADPEIVEEWKWMGTPVWSHGGIVCTGEAYKNVVKMTFAKGAALDDPSGLFNSSLDGNVRRAIDIHEGDTIDPTALKNLIRAAVALNLMGKSKPKPRRARSKRAD